MGTNQIAAWDKVLVAFNRADGELKKLTEAAALTINALQCEWARHQI